MTTNHDVPAVATKPKATKATKAKTVRKASKKLNGRGGGRALADFKDADRITVLKPKEIVRNGCFRTGQTVIQCLTAQKEAGLRGRRKYIRKQVALGRVAFK